MKCSKLKRNKSGSGAAFFQAYKMGNRWLRNKISRLKVHMKRLPNDKQTAKRLEELKSE